MVFFAPAREDRVIESSLAGARILCMEKYQSLVAWQRAHEVARETLRVTDRCDHARARVLFDQLRRAAVSIEANIVEGYGLDSSAQFARHLRIALGSAAELECLIRLATEVEYLTRPEAARLEPPVAETMRCIRGLLRAISHRPS